MTDKLVERDFSKSSPGNRDCLAKAKPGEPMFIILGRDPDGANIVGLWAERRTAAGEPEHGAKVQAIAEAMREWVADPANAPESAPPPSAYPPLTLPQTDLEQRAREMLGEEYAEANLAPVLTTNGPTGKRDKAAIRAITKALASSSVPEQDSLSLTDVAGRIEDIWAQMDLTTSDGAFTGRQLRNLQREIEAPPQPGAPQDRCARQEDAEAIRAVLWNGLCPGLRRTPEDDARFSAAARAALAIFNADEPPPPPEAPQDRGASQEDGR